MRKRWIVGALVTFAAARAVAADEVHVATGPLPADEGVAVAGHVFVFGRMDDGPLTVVLARRDPDARSAPPLTLTMDDGDAFRFEGLVPGVFDLSVSGDGVAKTVRQVAAFSDTVDATVRIPAPCNLRVRVALAIDARPEDVLVEVRSVDGATRGGGRPEDGVVEVGELPPGRYWVSATVPAAEGSDPPEDLGDGWVQVDLASDVLEAAVRVTARADVRFAARSARKGEFVEGVLLCRERPEWQVREPFRVTAGANDEDVVTGMSNGIFGGHWLEPGADVPVAGLTSGEFTMTVEALGFAPWEQRVVADGTTRVDAVLAPLPGRYFTLSEEQKDFLVQVEVRPATGGRWTPLLMRDRRMIVIDGDDEPTLRAFLPPGRYQVSATTDSDPPSAPQTIEVTGDRTTVELKFEHGRVRWIDVKTKSRAGDPIGGFVVHCFVREGDDWRALPPKDRAVRYGKFQIAGLAPGSYLLAYDAAGVFPLGRFEMGDTNIAREFIVSRRPDPSAQVGAPEHVAQGSLPVAEGFVVAGTLVGDGKDPVHLELARMVTDPVSQRGCAWSWRTVDLKPGERFRFVGVPPGQYMLWMQGRRVEAFDVFADHLGHEFRVPSTNLRGVIRPAFETKGERMTISFQSDDGKFDTRFQCAPGAEFETPALSPGRHAVEVWWIQQSSWDIWNQPRRWMFVDVTSDTKRFDFDFLPAADVTLSVRSAGKPDTFEGKVFDADLPESSAFPFRVQAEGDRTLGTCVYEPSVFGAAFGAPKAAARFGNVTRGTHRLRFEAPGFETLERSVEVEDGATAIDVALTPIPGTFVVAEGPGLLFEVFVRPADGRGAWRGLLFGDNRSVPTHTDPMRPRELLAPGKWEFMATTADLAPSPKTIELGADHAELKIELDCVPGATFRGTLKTPSGVALTDTETWVFVRDDAGWLRLRAKAPMIDEHGAFTIRGLAPGTYRIAFDELANHVAGEFEIGDADISRDFVFRAR